MGQRRQKRQVEVRAEADGRSDGEGIVHALVSAYGHEYVIDAHGTKERIAPGAFADADTVPIYHQHDHDSAPIGAAEPQESDDGLTIQGRLFLEDSEDARAVFRALEAGALRSWSVGFIPTKVREDGDVNEVLKADLREVSTVLVPASDATETILVRSGDGSTVSLAKRKRQREAAMKLGQVLADLPIPGSTRDRFVHAYANSRRFRRLVDRVKGRAA